MIKLIPNTPLDNMVTLEKGGKALMEKSYDENSDELTIKPGLSPEKLKDAIYNYYLSKFQICFINSNKNLIQILVF